MYALRATLGWTLTTILLTACASGEPADSDPRTDTDMDTEAGPDIEAFGEDGEVDFTGLTRDVVLEHDMACPVDLGWVVVRNFTNRDRLIQTYGGAGDSPSLQTGVGTMYTRRLPYVTTAPANGEVPVAVVFDCTEMKPHTARLEVVFDGDGSGWPRYVTTREVSVDIPEDRSNTTLTVVNNGPEAIREIRALSTNDFPVILCEDEEIAVGSRCTEAIKPGRRLLVGGSVNRCGIEVGPYTLREGEENVVELTAADFDCR